MPAKSPARQRRSEPARPPLESRKEPKSTSRAGLRHAARARAERLLTLSELGLAGTLTVLAVVGHLQFLRRAGALWRDETQIFNLATMPSASEIWKNLEIDTFPLVWPMLVRAWSALSLGSSDRGLRVLGVIVGLGIILLVWRNARRLGSPAPALALALFALSPTVIRYGDSLRGYGLGSLTMLVMVGSTWELVREPTLRRFLLALGAALLAVQSMYFNATILLALAAGSAAVSLRRRSLRPAADVVGIGLVAAVSLLPYIDPLSRQSRWNAIIKYGVDTQTLFDRFKEAITAYGEHMVWVWLGLGLLGLAGCVVGCVAAPRRTAREGADLPLFMGTTAVFAILFYIEFLLTAGLPTAPWYYIALLGVLALGIETGVSFLARSLRARSVRLVAAAVIAAVVMPRAWSEVSQRMTNVDLLAAHLEKAAVAGDYILVTPWWPSVTFTRYYHGAAAWSQLPDLGPLKMQRYDLFRQKMDENDPIQPVLDRIVAALGSGHSLWVVGQLAPVERGDKPGELAPPSRGGPLEETPYLVHWSRLVTDLLQSHIREANPVQVPSPAPVSPIENIGLMEIRGWR
jgi:hypothetical protein